MWRCPVKRPGQSFKIFMRQVKEGVMPLSRRLVPPVDLLVRWVLGWEELGRGGAWAGSGPRPLEPRFLLQLHRQRAWRVHTAPGLPEAAAGEQGALRGPEAAAAPAGAAAPGAGGIQEAAAGGEAEADRAAEGAAATAGRGGGTWARAGVPVFVHRHGQMPKGPFSVAS